MTAMRRALSRALLAVYVVALAFALVRLPGVGNPDDLDSAWQGLLFHDWQHGARAGVESVFTHGPTGWMLAQFLFAVDGLVVRFVAAWLVAVATAIALLSIVRHLPGRAWRVCYLALLLLLAPSLEGSRVFQAMVALGVATLIAVTAPDADGRREPTPAAASDGAVARDAGPGRSAIAMLVVAAVAFAVMGLAKFSYFALGCLLIAAIAVALVRVRRFRFAAATPALFAAAIAVVWLASGQSLADLPTWLHASAEIASGYNETMGLRGDLAETGYAVALLGVDTALALWLLLAARRADEAPRWTAPGNGRRAAALAAVLGGQFLAWKAGFVRPDPGHTMMYFGFTTTAAFQLLAAAQLRRVPLPLGSALGLAIVAGAWTPLAALAHYRMYLTPDDMYARSVALCRPDIYVDYCRHFLLEMKSVPLLPRLRERVGDEPVDLMGHQQGQLLGSGLRVRHRPVFQGYSAYTPYLQRLNGEFFRGPQAPRLTLAKLQSIDDHPPTAEDSQAWLALLQDYHAVMIERRIALLERNAAAGAPEPARLVVDRTAGFGEWIEVPATDEWHELSLDIDFTLAGRAASLLFRAERLRLEVRLDDDERQTFSIAPCLVREPFLIDPLLRNTADFVRTWTGGPLARVRAFAVDAEPGRAWQFGERFAVRLLARSSAGHTLPRDRLGTLERDVAAMSYPGFSWFPYKAAPRRNILDDRTADGVLAHAPCTLFFRWPGGRHRITARYEILDVAYSGAVRTDGAAFRVEVADGTAESPRRVVFERLLVPLEREGDRGLQPLLLDLDLPPDTVVALVTDPGPAGAVDLDWTTWREVALDHD